MALHLVTYGSAWGDHMKCQRSNPGQSVPRKHLTCCTIALAPEDIILVLPKKLYSLVPSPELLVEGC